MAPVEQSVSFSFGTTQLEGYLARPDGDGPFPGVVVIHERAYRLGPLLRSRLE